MKKTKQLMAIFAFLTVYLFYKEETAHKQVFIVSSIVLPENCLEE